MMDKKTKRLLMVLKLCIQVGIALLLSLVITLVNKGVTAAFVQDWAKGFVVAFVIVPLALWLIPFVAAGVRAVLGARSSFVIRGVVAICVAVMMEGLIALAVTLAQQGLASGWTALWGAAFVRALPVGLFIGFTMTFIVQPRMQRLASPRLVAGEA